MNNNTIGIVQNFLLPLGLDRHLYTELVTCALEVVCELFPKGANEISRDSRFYRDLRPSFWKESDGTDLVLMLAAKGYMVSDSDAETLSGIGRSCVGDFLIRLCACRFLYDNGEAGPPGVPIRLAVQ